MGPSFSSERGAGTGPNKGKPRGRLGAVARSLRAPWRSQYEQPLSPPVGSSALSLILMANRHRNIASQMLTLVDNRLKIAVR